MKRFLLVVFLLCSFAFCGEPKKYEAKITKDGSTISRTVYVEARNKDEARKIFIASYPGHKVTSVRERK